jgi:predicted DNA-binding transcriptional regulator YafY
VPITSIHVVYDRHVRARRLVSLLLLLQTHARLSARELAEALGVSVRTVQRDIEALADAGVPIHADRGAAGGYALAPGYRTRLTGLSQDEARALLVGGAPGPAAELGLGTLLASAQLKVLAALPPELRREASRAARLFHLDAPVWFRTAERTPHLAAVAGALWQGRRIGVRYRSGRDWKVVRRVLDPLGLVLKAGVWYLVGRGRSGIRVYRVSRLASVTVREEPAERPRGFDLAVFWSQWLEEFETSRPQVDVEIRIHRSAVPELKMAVPPLGRAALADAAAAKKTAAADWLQVVVPFERLEHAERDLLGLGDRVEVLGPPELRARVAAAARSVAEIYSRGPAGLDSVAAAR